MASKKHAPGPGEVPLFSTEDSSHDGIRLEPTYDMNPTAQPLMAKEKKPEPSREYEARNEKLIKVVEPGGYLALVGKRKGAIEVQNRHGGGWVPPRLQQHAEDKDSSFPEYAEVLGANYEDLQRATDRTISKACGLCALRNECEFGENPKLFKERFGDYKSRQKLLKALDKEPATKCDTIATPKK